MSAISGALLESSASSRAGIVGPVPVPVSCPGAGGDVIVLEPSGIWTEIVIGFRPGLDRLIIKAASPSRLCLREDGGSAEISDGRGGCIVVQGVGAGELAAGGIELAVQA